MRRAQSLAVWRPESKAGGGTEAMSKAGHHYIPALKYDYLSSLYDPVIRLTARDAISKRHLMSQARIEPTAASPQIWGVGQRRLLCLSSICIQKRK